MTGDRELMEKIDKVSKDFLKDMIVEVAINYYTRARKIGGWTKEQGIAKLCEDFADHKSYIVARINEIENLGSIDVVLRKRAQDEAKSLYEPHAT